MRADDPQTLIGIALRGAGSGATSAEPTAPAMPGYGWQLHDREVAADLTYIRAAWSSKAPPVPAERVRSEREALASRDE